MVVGGGGDSKSRREGRRRRKGARAKAERLRASHAPLGGGLPACLWVGVCVCVSDCAIVSIICSAAAHGR